MKISAEMAAKKSNNNYQIKYFGLQLHGYILEIKPKLIEKPVGPSV